MLIACPECTDEVSDLAVACPHCGFPVAAHVNRELMELTGVGKAKSARQRAAQENLRHWGERYAETGRVLSDSASDKSLDRNRKVIIFAVVAAVVILQLAFLLSAVN